MRWADGEVEHRGRLLRVESELGTSWQAQLVLGALPERIAFPGSQAELMFAPPESLPFGDRHDAERALPRRTSWPCRIARRRIQDADQILRPRRDGEQGVSDLGYERTQEARDLLALPAGLEPAAAPAGDARDRRVGAGSRRSSSSAWRCAGAHTARSGCTARSVISSSCSLQHLPGQRTRVAGYDDMLTSEQVAAMMPTATHAAGLASRLLPRPHAVGVAASRFASTCARDPTATATRPS